MARVGEGKGMGGSKQAIPRDGDIPYANYISIQPHECCTDWDIKGEIEVNGKRDPSFAECFCLVARVVKSCWSAG